MQESNESYAPLYYDINLTELLSPLDFDYLIDKLGSNSGFFYACRDEHEASWQEGRYGEYKLYSGPREVRIALSSLCKRLYPRLGLDTPGTIHELWLCIEKIEAVRVRRLNIRIHRMTTRSAILVNCKYKEISINERRLISESITDLKEELL